MVSKLAGSRRAVRTRLAAAVVAIAVALVGAPAAPAQAATGDVGYQGPSYKGTYKPATSDKPQSKLWHAHGMWWAVMWDTVSGDWHIFRLNRPTNKWVDTKILVDKRYDTLADVLYDSAQGKVYIASHVVTLGFATAGKPARLMRYTYANGTWVLDAGFPTQIMNYSGESMAIDKDTAGNVWATWSEVPPVYVPGKVEPVRKNSEVYVARGANGGASWGQPFLVPSADPKGNLPRPDDISTVIAFGNKIGVLWSNQTTSTFYWSVHLAGAAERTWTTGIAFRNKGIADDHLNIKSLQADASGRVYAIMKTDYNDFSTDKTLPQVILGTYSAGRWKQTTVWTIGNCVTRPMVLLNTSTQRVYAIGTAPETGCRYSGQKGVIFKKTAPMDNPTFPTGRGTVIMKDADSPNLDDVTSTKQTISTSTGLVLLAANPATKRYWYSDSKATQ